MVVVLDEGDQCVYAFGSDGAFIQNLKSQPLEKILDPKQNQNAFRALQSAKTSGKVQVSDEVINRLQPYREPQGVVAGTALLPLLRCQLAVRCRRGMQDQTPRVANVRLHGLQY